MELRIKKSNALFILFIVLTLLAVSIVHAQVWGSPDGEIQGTVTDSTTGLPIQDARVEAVGDSFTFTDSNGDYSLPDLESNKAYDVVTSKAPYTPTTTTAVWVGDFEVVTLDVELGVGPSDCESDCTFSSDSTCHAECAGVNNCAFYDQTVLNICNNQEKDFRFPYGPGLEVQCCTGTPYAPQKISAEAEISAKNTVRITRNVWYEGKLVKLVVDVFE